MNCNIISSLRVRTFVFVFGHQVTQIRRHVTRQQMNERDAATSSFNFDWARHVSQRHHARRFDAGWNDDDRPSAVYAFAGSDVIGLTVDLEDKVSGVEVRNVVFGRRVSGCRKSVKSCRPGYQCFGGNRRVHRWAPARSWFPLRVDPPIVNNMSQQNYFSQTVPNRID